MKKREDDARAIARPRLARAWSQGPGRRAALRATARRPIGLPALGAPTMRSHPTSGEGVAARVRWASGEVEYPLKELSALPLEEALPIRLPSNHNRALSNAGLMPMTKVDRVLATESNVERLVALAIDFDGGYTGISAQPFKLQLREDSLHVPDFALRRSDGSLAVVDVRPRDRRDEVSARKFDEMTVLMSWAGLEYHVVAGPTVVQQFNLRFLAAFSRRPRLWTQCRPALVHMATTRPSITWGELRECLRDMFGLQHLWAQPIVGHAVWVGLLSVNLDVPIHNGSTLTWTPEREMAVVR